MNERGEIVSVFAIDPGGTTGWCFIQDADLATIPHGECDLEIACSQLTGLENVQATDLYKLILACGDSAVGSNGLVAIVMEDFIPRQLNKEKYFLSPVRIIAKVELLLWQDSRKVFLQQPSTAKGTISDEYLKAAGLYNVGLPHANDATRHALTYLRRIQVNPIIHSRNIARISVDESDY